MGATIRSTVHGWWRAMLVGLVLALLFGALVASRNPQHELALVVGVTGVITWLIFAAALQLFLFDRAATERDLAKGELSVEHAWTQEAGATAFFTMIGGLIFLDTVGDVLNLSWMSPVGLTHALVLGFGTFAVSYGWLRARGR